MAKLFTSDPSCPSGMPFFDELYQPLAIGPVGQPFVTGPLGEHVSEPDCKWRSQIYNGPGGSTGIMDAVNQTGRDVQTGRLSICTRNGPASSGNIPPSSDSGVHSWNEQWENMSENLTYSAAGQTVGSDCEGSGRMPLSEIRAPLNTEEEEDSDCPWMDRVLSRKLDGCSLEVVYGEDGRIPYSAATGSGSYRNTDIAALSDFSDDSAETGVRRLSDCRVPIPVHPISTPWNPWNQPVDHACTAIPESEVWPSYFHDLPIKSSLLEWDRKVLPGPEDPEGFYRGAERMLSEALARDEDPLLDKAYPEFIQCMVKCMRISRNTWGEHDARLEEQGKDCTTPGCQCDLRGETMFPIFVKGMGTDDSESEEIADCNEQPCGMGSSDSDSEDVVPRTYTPPPAEETQPEVCKSEET